MMAMISFISAPVMVRKWCIATIMPEQKRRLIG
jgi:hypothetical protein